MDKVLASFLSRANILCNSLYDSFQSTRMTHHTISLTQYLNSEREDNGLFTWGIGGDHWLGSRGDEDMLGCDGAPINLYLRGADKPSMPRNILHIVFDQVVGIDTIQSLDIVITSLLDRPAVRGD